MDVEPLDGFLEAVGALPRQQLDRDLVSVDVDRLDRAVLEQASCEYVRRPVPAGVSGAAVLLVTHAGQDAVELETDDAFPLGRLFGDRDGLAHGAPQRTLPR